MPLPLPDLLKIYHTKIIRALLQRVCRACAVASFDIDFFFHQSGHFVSVSLRCCPCSRLLETRIQSSIRYSSSDMQARKGWRRVCPCPASTHMPPRLPLHLVQRASNVLLYLSLAIRLRGGRNGGGERLGDPLVCRVERGGVGSGHFSDGGSLCILMSDGRRRGHPHLSRPPSLSSPL